MFPIRDHNPSLSRPIITYVLIALNVIIFLMGLPMAADPVAMERFYSAYALLPARVTAGQDWLGFLTSQFLHGGWMHLGGNMLFLWIFGDNLEDQLGKWRFLGFYLLSGIAAGMAQVAYDPQSMVPMVGASGAIAGVMGGYLLLFPKARVDILLIIVIFFKVFPLPAWIVLALWFAMQVVMGAATSVADGGVAYWAHAGGFAAGALMCWPLWRARGGTAFWSRTHGHPPHPAAQYRRTSIPKVGKR